jgi:Fe-S oxidoreductase
MVSTTYIDAFVPEGKRSDQCADCGLCLQKCPVMKMGKEESKAEMRRLLEGTDPERVFNECTFCFSCNHFCPNGLRPYALIMERITAKNRESGVEYPAAFEYLITGKHESGYFFDKYNAAPAEDKAILERWAKVPAKAKETLFIGCFGRTVPQSIEYSKVLESLPKYAPRDACCGEIPYRFGDYQSFAELVEHTRQQLEALDTERLICYCGSCTNFLGNVWPNYHGVKLPFEVVSLWEWLWDKLQAGELTMQRQAGKKAVITDSCYSSELGDSFYEAMRGLHEAAGMSVVELENNRYDNFSCGFACGIRNNYDQSQVAFQRSKKMEQILSTNVEDVNCYCPGCWAGLLRPGTKAGLKVHYAMDEILWAFGDDVPSYRS